MIREGQHKPTERHAQKSPDNRHFKVNEAVKCSTIIPRPRTKNQVLQYTTSQFEQSATQTKQQKLHQGIKTRQFLRYQVYRDHAGAINNAEWPPNSCRMVCPSTKSPSTPNTLKNKTSHATKNKHPEQIIIIGFLLKIFSVFSGNILLHDDLNISIISHFPKIVQKQPLNINISEKIM